MNPSRKLNKLFETRCFSAPSVSVLYFYNLPSLIPLQSIIPSCHQMELHLTTQEPKHAIMSWPKCLKFSNWKEAIGKNIMLLKAIAGCFQSNNSNYWLRHRYRWASVLWEGTEAWNEWEVIAPYQQSNIFL